MEYYTNAIGKPALPDTYQERVDKGELILADPKATERYTTDELIKMKLVGLYHAGDENDS